MTPILLPPEWESMILGDFAEVKYGKARPKTSGSIPVIGSGGEYGRPSTPLIDFPTIVIGRKGTAGLAWLQEQPCWPSDTTFYLQWKSKIIDRDYLYYHLQAKPLSGQHAKTTLPSILKQDLEKYSILAPPLPEQRAIALALRAAQGAREARLQEVALERERKAALMEHLFTHGTRGGATKMTEIWEMPESWKTGKIGDFIKFKNGESRPDNIVSKPALDKTVPVYGGNGIMGYTNKIFSENRHLIIGRVGEYCGCIHVAEPASWITDNALYSEKWLSDRLLFHFAASYLNYRTCLAPTSLHA